MKESPILSACLESEKGCFSNPSIPLESMSYDIPTPQACRGMLEAIYWKPEMTYIVESVEVCSPIKKETMMFNGVLSKADPTSVKGYYYPENKRVQRHITYLVNPKYRINFRIILVSPPDKERNTLKKHIDIFIRRLKKVSPYRTVRMGMGGEGFFASVYAERDWKPIPETRNLGTLFYGHDYKNIDDNNRYPRHFFSASIKNGVVEFPHPDKVFGEKQ